MLVEYVTVVVIKSGVIHDSLLFIGEHDEIAKRAERKFLALCGERIPEHEKYTQDDTDTILENGFCEFGVGDSICINWPDVQ